jgi:16S rRNA U516 pseudouridylate synthase RsuA-like enzyme
VRLQAFLARSGAAPSRRKAEALISAGRVKVNGRIALLGESAAPSDLVLLD